VTTSMLCHKPILKVVTAQVCSSSRGGGLPCSPDGGGTLKGRK
jgi:hypothetical protein